MDESTFAADALPPEGEYESRESLFKEINNWAKSRGYAFTTAKSSKPQMAGLKLSMPAIVIGKHRAVLSTVYAALRAGKQAVSFRC